MNTLWTTERSFWGHRIALTLCSELWVDRMTVSDIGGKRLRVREWKEGVEEGAGRGREEEEGGRDREWEHASNKAICCPSILPTHLPPHTHQ